MMRYLAQGLHPYSFEVAYRARRRNFISHFILKNFVQIPWNRLVRLHENEKYEIVNAFLASFWYVGNYTDCDDLIAALAVEVEILSRATPRNTRAEWERRVKWRALQVEDLSPNVVAQIKRENTLDQRLWEAWHEAKHDTAFVRPPALDGKSSPSLVMSEATRFLNQIARRIQRRCGIFKGLSPDVNHKVARGGLTTHHGG
jgi:hypothetical protein